MIAGVLRGSGRQLLGAGINVVCYYVFGLPVGISLALATEKFEGTLGIWIGLGIASFTQVEKFTLYNMPATMSHDVNILTVSWSFNSYDLHKLEERGQTSE